MLRLLIDRPVGICMVMIALVVLSILGIRTLSISLLPEVTIPRIIIKVYAPQLDVRALEEVVIGPIRRELLQVSGLRDVRSVTRSGSASLRCYFDYGKDVEMSIIEINEKLDQIWPEFPSNIRRPRVAGVQITDLPAFYVSIVSRQASSSQRPLLSDWVDKIIKKRIEQLDEVGFVDISGSVHLVVQIRPKNQVLRSLGLSEEDILKVVQDRSQELGSIMIRRGAYEYQVLIESGLETIHDLESIPMIVGNRIFSLQELAGISVISDVRQSAFLKNGVDGFALAVFNRPGSNHFLLKRNVLRLMEDLQSEFPDLKLQLYNNQSGILLASIEGLGKSLILSVFIVWVIAIPYFGNWRIASAVLLVLPVGLVLSLLGFKFLNISFNLLSLAGLLLGTGLMIDNAIVVVDNIVQHSRTQTWKEACLAGPNEVIHSLIASSLTTCSVFLPLIYLGGLTGSLIRDQGLSIALVLGSSLLVSYFGLPIFLYHVLKSGRHRLLRQPTSGIRTFIPSLNRIWILPSVIFSLITCYWLFNDIDKDLFPHKSSQSLQLNIDWGGSISLSENLQRINELHEITAGLEVESAAYLGESEFILDTEDRDVEEAKVEFFCNRETREQLTQNIMDWMSQCFPLAHYEISDVKGIFDFTFGYDEIGAVALLQTASSSNLPPLDRAVTVVNALKEHFSDLHFPPTTEYLSITIDSEKLAVLNVSYSSVVEKLKLLFGNLSGGYLPGAIDHWPIKIGYFRGRPFYQSVSNHFVYSKDGRAIPLSTLISTELQNDYRKINGGPNGPFVGLNLGDHFDGLEALVRSVVTNLGDFQVRFGGNYRAIRLLMKESKLLGIVVILLLYLILAIQFESLIQPFIIGAILPVSIAGSLIGIWMAGETLNVMTVAGLFVMIGILMNDAILKIDCYNRNLKNGMELNEAILDGSQRRLHPIVLTSLTTILAIAPVFFTSGLGRDLQGPLSIAIIGGLITGTIGSLTLIPHLYRIYKKTLCIQTHNSFQ